MANNEFKYTVGLDVEVTGEEKIKRIAEGFATSIDEIQERLKKIKEEAVGKGIEFFGDATADLATLNEQFDTLKKNLENAKKNLALAELFGDKKDIEEARKFLKEVEETFNKFKEKTEKGRISALKINGSNAKAESEFDNQMKYERDGMKRIQTAMSNFASGNLNAFSLKNINSSIGSIFTERINDKLRDNEKELAPFIKDLADGKLTKEGYIEATKGINADNKKLMSKNMAIAAVQGSINMAIKGVQKFGQISKQIFETMGISLTSISKEVISNITSMLNSSSGLMSYNTGTSLFTNANARSTQMKYGISSSQSYALSKTMGMLGMSNDEDLMYMNENQKEAFNRLMQKNSDWFDRLNSSGALERIQEIQLTFAEFKQDLSYTVLDWFAQNKDVILNIMKFTMDVMSNLLDAITNVLNLFGLSTASSTGSSLTSDTNNINNAKTINVNVNSTNNATAVLSNQAQLQSALDTSNSNLIKSIGSTLTALY